jgi:hypothetical protein
MPFVYDEDPYDPSDDVDEPAEVLDADEDDPVELVEDPEVELPEPPEDWAQSISAEEWNERLDGVEVTEDPEDGEPG